ncbi:MAG TPA: YtxH domain-containing protein [Bacteroidales bacterium]|nr:YtxH domain-containing protein [Bacteroidales bacterium]
MAKSSSKVLLAGITGLAAGVAIGLLFAPAKGSKTRKRLKKRLMSVAETIEDDVTDKLGALKSVFSGEEEEDEEEDVVQTAGEPVKADKRDA